MAVSLDGQNLLRLAPALCVYARGRGGRRAACARVCPSGAIRVGALGQGGGPAVDTGRCDACGLCASACAVGAVDRPASAAATWAALERAVSANRVLSVRCRVAGGGDGGGACLEVPCLASVGMAALAAAGALGASAVRLDDRACGGCPRRRGLSLSRRAVRRARRLFSHFDRRVDLVFESGGRHPRPRARAHQEAGTGVLARLRAGLRRLEAEPVEVTGAVRQAPSERALLARALPLLGPPREEKAPGGACGLNSPTVSSACDACGVCAALCPTEALQLHEGAAPGPRSGQPSHESVLALCAPLCVGCGLCVERCPQAAVRLDEPVALRAFQSSEPVALARVAREICRRCRRPITGVQLTRTRSGLCPECDFIRRAAASLAGAPS